MAVIELIGCDDLNNFLFHCAFQESYNQRMVFWVFGYGSLVWNPGFEYDEKVIGFIKDYKRVFDLGIDPLLSLSPCGRQ